MPVHFGRVKIDEVRLSGGKQTVGKRLSCPHRFKFMNLVVKIFPLYHDPADLDSDGQFDGIDIAILEKEEREIPKQPGRQNSGCCVPFVVCGLITIGYAVTKLIV